MKAYAQPRSHPNSYNITLQTPKSPTNITTIKSTIQRQIQSTPERGRSVVPEPLWPAPRAPTGIGSRCRWWQKWRTAQTTTQIKKTHKNSNPRQHHKNKNPCSPLPTRTRPINGIRAKKSESRVEKGGNNRPEVGAVAGGPASGESFYRLPRR